MDVPENKIWSKTHMSGPDGCVFAYPLKIDIGTETYFSFHSVPMQPPEKWNTIFHWIIRLEEAEQILRLFTTATGSTAFFYGMTRRRFPPCVPPDGKTPWNLGRRYGTRKSLFFWPLGPCLLETVLTGPGRWWDCRKTSVSVPFPQLLHFNMSKTAWCTSWTAR